MSISHALRLNSSVLLSAAADGYVAYDVRLDRLYRLNPTAALIVELCDGTRDLTRLQTDLEPLIGDDWQRCVGWIDTATRDELLTDAPPGPGAISALDAAELSTLADTLWHRDRVLAAFVCQQRAVDLAPDDPDMWVKLGELAHIVGRRDEARNAYQRYLWQCPDDAEVAHLLTALNDATPPARVSDRCIEQLYCRFAAFYDESMVEELDYCAPDRLYDAVAAEIGGRTGLDVLDLGCGTGLNGARWRARAGRLVGIDLSPEMIARAGTRGIYDSIETAEITRWLARQRSDQFDLIVACDTLIYFGDLAQVVTKAGARLRQTGVLAFTLERGTTHPFQLSDSGRFAHHPDYVAGVVTAAGLTLLELDETFVRREYGEPVVGLIAVCATEPAAPRRAGRPRPQGGWPGTSAVARRSRMRSGPLARMRARSRPARTQ